VAREREEEEEEEEDEEEEEERHDVQSVAGTDLSPVQTSSLKISTLNCCRVFRRTSFDPRYE
jgi:hypothetical protein